MVSADQKAEKAKLSTVSAETPTDGGRVVVLDAPPDPTTVVEEQKPVRKVAIVGYTTSKEEAPYGNPEWELWGMNNLHMSEGFDASHFHRWYNLHDLSKLHLPEEQGGDPAHFAWLKQWTGCPVFLMDPLEGVATDPAGDPIPSLAERTGFPAAVPLPKAAILAQFPRYFTNTVSWQIAHLMLEAMRDDSTVLTDLALYGIDMAVGTEYAAQRPSVEYFLGLIQGCGVELHLPPSSDLLKSAELYGGEDENSGMRAKLAQRLRELYEQKGQVENQMSQLQNMHASICGAIDSFRYIQGVWVPPAAGNDGRDAVKAPDGALTPIAQFIAEGDARDRHRKDS